MGHVGLSILDNVNWRMVRPFSVTVTGAASLRASLKRARIGGSDASRGRFSFSLSRCAPELTTFFFFFVRVSRRCVPFGKRVIRADPSSSQQTCRNSL